MTGKKRFWLLLPLGLGLAGLMLLIRISFVDTDLMFPQDLDLVLILLGLGLAIFAAIILILKEEMEHSRQRSVDRVREEALAGRLRFLRRLDHELKNPLTAFRAGLGSLTITLTDANQRQIVQTLEAEAQHLSRLISSLRKLAELETLPLETQVIDIRAFFTEVSELAHERIDLHNRQFSVELPPGVTDSSLIGDPDLLLLAVHNLLDNAFKYTHRNDHISLRVRKDGDDLVIQVIDTGIGIPEAEIPLVWEELYRGKNAEDVPGNGIGLALVKAIVERHYGGVSMHSEAGQGTTVTLRLPLT